MWSYGYWIDIYIYLQSVAITTYVWIRTQLRTRCIQYSITWKSLSVTCGRSVVFCFPSPYIYIYCVGGVMVSVLASSAVDRGFNPRLGETKDYKISMCCFSAKHAALRRKSKDWWARNQDNVSEWVDMSICGLLLQWASTINFQLSVLV